MATVDGVTTAPGATGVVVGNGGDQDRMAGGSGNDKLEGTAKQNIYYGGEGSDTFIVDNRYLDTSHGSLTANTAANIGYSNLITIVTDFQGAGMWSATNNDFLAFTNFAAGSTITEITTASTATANAPNAVTHYYDLLDQGSGLHYVIAINSVNGAALAAQDYKFF